MEVNFERVLKKCFTLWTRDSKTWKYYFGLVVTGTVFVGILIGLLFVLFGNVASEALANPQLLEDPQFLEAMIPQILSNLFLFFLAIVPVAIIFSLVSFYLETLVSLRALELNGLKPAPFSFTKLLRLFLLHIFSCFAAAFSIYNKWGMIFSVLFFALILIDVVLFFVALPLGVLLAFILVILLLVYIPLLFYNMYRLILAPTIFLHKETPITQATRESWQVSKGNLISIFILSFVLGIAIYVINAFVEFLGRLIGGALDAVSGTFVFTLAVVLFASIFVSILLGIASLHLLPAIYAELLNATQTAKPEVLAKEQKEPKKWASRRAV